MITGQAFAAFWGEQAGILTLGKVRVECGGACKVSWRRLRLQGDHHPLTSGSMKDERGVRNADRFPTKNVNDSKRLAGRVGSSSMSADGKKASELRSFDYSPANPMKIAPPANEAERLALQS